MPQPSQWSAPRHQRCQWGGAGEEGGRIHTYVSLHACTSVWMHVSGECSQNEEIIVFTQLIVNQHVTLIRSNRQSSQLTDPAIHTGCLPLLRLASLPPTTTAPLRSLPRGLVPSSSSPLLLWAMVPRPCTVSMMQSKAVRLSSTSFCAAALFSFSSLRAADSAVLSEFCSEWGSDSGTGNRGQASSGLTISLDHSSLLATLCCMYMHMYVCIAILVHAYVCIATIVQGS